jgi:magnesium chelatase family protein
VVSHLRGEQELPPVSATREVVDHEGEPDLAEVRGQELARRALELAAAGGHNILFIGPPGTGKSMLAGRLPGVLPPLTHEEALETSALWSVAGLLEPGATLLRRRPLRAPHHSASDVGVIGGGVPPMPGELSLAHNGVLFLDELPEFRRPVLEALRQPLEQEVVVIARASYRVTFPARVMLVATMNPCPCGLFGDRKGGCSCSRERIRRYRGRVSGPLLDRIDLHVEVPSLPIGQLEALPRGESSAEVRCRVLEARELQRRRYAGLEARLRTNADLAPRALHRFAALDRASRQLLASATERLGLSARGYDRVRKLARTAADLAGREAITASDVAEAVSFRALDRAPEA